ncbi:MAG: M23 family metallopeptidase [Alphaproteobacteria bacterium]
MTQQLAQEDTSAATGPNDKYNVMFQRIDMLENKVKELQSAHDEMLADIRSTTGGKIKEFDAILAETGVNAQPLVAQAQARQNQAEQAKEKYGRAIDPNAKGGPLEPVPGSVLKEKETELYFDIKQMMTLRDIVAALPLSNPENGEERETSGFGVRIDPFTGALGFHSGVDLAGPPGAPVHAANEGTVAFAGWKNAYGNAVDISHQYGFSTRYGHLSKILVKEGQHVSKGDVIALQGSTGRSTGNHLHYEVRYNDQPINPQKFLKAGRGPCSSARLNRRPARRWAAGARPPPSSRRT